MNLKQTVALVSPIEKGDSFLTDKEEVDDEMFTKVNLTDDGTVSNGGTEPKDGLNVKVDLTEDGTISNGGTEPKELLNGSNEVDPNGDGGSNKVPEKGSMFSTPLGKEVSYLTDDETKKAWQGAISTTIIKPGSNEVSNRTDEVMEENNSNTSGSKENPEDACEMKGGIEGTLSSTSTVSFSTKDGVVQSPKSVSNKDGAVQGGDDSGYIVMEGALPSTKSVKYVGFSDEPHPSHEDEVAQIMIAIGDTQHLIESSTGVKLTIAKEDMTKLQHSLSEKKKTTTPKDDMAINVHDPVDKPSKEQLDKNTTIIPISSIRPGSLDNLVTPVWKYSQHQPQHASIATIKNSIWKKILAFKNVEDIVSQPDTTKFQDVWSSPTPRIFLLTPLS